MFVHEKYMDINSEYINSICTRNRFEEINEYLLFIIKCGLLPRTFQLENNISLKIRFHMWGFKNVIFFPVKEYMKLHVFYATLYATGPFSIGKSLFCLVFDATIA